MGTMHSATRLFFELTVIALLCTSCAIGGGIKDSDPHLVGKRDMNYDHLIVPGDRIGPVGLGSTVSSVVQHLGEPDKVWRSTFRGPGYDGDEVSYYYEDECIQFTWMDTGVEPTVERGLRGIIVYCDKWATADGLHVGTSIKDVISHLGQYCPSNFDDGSLLIQTKEGIWYHAPNRNGAVVRILVMPVMDNWGGACKD